MKETKSTPYFSWATPLKKYNVGVRWHSGLGVFLYAKININFETRYQKGKGDETKCPLLIKTLPLEKHARTERLDVFNKCPLSPALQPNN